VLQDYLDRASPPPRGRRKSGTGGLDSNVQNLSYLWDTAGNLTSRSDLRQVLTESFTYDALDRMTLASGPGVQSMSVSYDSIGNITSKSDVGSYTYHATKKHAVVSAGGTSYTYDPNGNLETRGGQTVSWRSYNLPYVTGGPGGYTATFSYASDRSRWKQVSTYSGTTETTIYVGGLLEKLTTGTRTHWKHLIATPSGQVQVIRRSDGTNETLYVTTDHLGSTDAVLNASGAVLLQASFGAYGARRGSNLQGAPSPSEWQAVADNTRRGYTGHEALDNVMLIHMNGRVFDPAIGRFLSPDPYDDGPDSTQGWNRYAYVHGRTMSATDPSGFIGVDGPSISPLDTALRWGVQTAIQVLGDVFSGGPKGPSPAQQQVLRDAGYVKNTIGKGRVSIVTWTTPDGHEIGNVSARAVAREKSSASSLPDSCSSEILG